MTTFIDTNALISILDENEPDHEWAVREFAACKARGPVLICDTVYCEWSVAMDTREHIDAAATALALDRYPQDDESLFRAGKAFLEYRRNRGTANQVLPDFVVGAVAEVNGAPLMTADVRRFRTYFPNVQLIHP